MEREKGISQNYWFKIIKTFIKQKSISIAS